MTNRRRCHKALENADGTRRLRDKVFTCIQIHYFYLYLIQTEGMLPVIDIILEYSNIDFVLRGYECVMCN
jgi:hypothetical protein